LTFSIMASHGDFKPEGVIFGFVATGVSTYCALNARKLRKKHEELGMLQFMALKNGRVSLAEIMLHLEITAERTKEILDRLQNHGVIVVEVTSNGELVYSVQDSFRQIERYMAS
jgi:hypothetical protein